MELKYVVKGNDINKSINEILKSEFNVSTRLRTKLISQNDVKLNGMEVDTRISPNFNDVLTINLGYEEDNSNVVPTQMDLDIVFEDEWFLVVNKPSGIAIHPSQLHYDTSLSNGIRFYFDSIGLKKKIRPVNRLDRNTSGLVVFAKCEFIQECFVNQMTDGSFEKEYLCIVHGIFDDDKKSGVIDLPIARKSDSIIERCVDFDNGKKSVTEYEVLKEFDNKFSLVRCVLKTGRTHQIRVHMGYIGHPLLGDSLYGPSSDLYDGQALHSYKISLIHPVTKEYMTFVKDALNDVF